MIWEIEVVDKVVNTIAVDRECWISYHLIQEDWPSSIANLFWFKSPDHNSRFLYKDNHEPMSQHHAMSSALECIML